MAIEVNSPVKVVPVKSKRFLCANCLTLVIEHVPVIRRGQGREYYEKVRRGILKPRTFPKVRLECPNGCSRSPFWSFYDVAGGKAHRPQK